jgi:hypothetical protein
MPLPPIVVMPRRGLGTNPLAALQNITQPAQNTASSTASSVTQNAQNQVQGTLTNAQNTAQNTLDNAQTTATTYVQNNLIAPLSSTAQNIYSALPPNVQTTLQTASTVINNAQPAFNLVSALVNGQSVTPQQELAALSAVVGVINPLAGAMLFSAGELFFAANDVFQQVFTALGLYSQPPASYDYIGLIRQGMDAVPAPPLPSGQTDPKWMSFTDPQQVPIGLCVGSVPKNIQAPYSPKLDTNWTERMPFLLLLYMAVLRSAPPTFYTLQVVNRGPVFINQGDGSWSGCSTNATADVSASPGGANITSPYTMAVLQANAPSAFEIFFNRLLVLNLTYWANGNPYIACRDLLTAAVQVWNASHGGPSVCFSPPPAGITETFDGVTQVNDKSAVPGMYYGPTYNYLLSPAGGLLSPINPAENDWSTGTAAGYGFCVNSPDGSNVITAVTTPPNTITSPASAPLAIASAALALPAAVSIGAVGYSLAAGQPWNTAFGAIVDWVRARLPL